MKAVDLCYWHYYLMGNVYNDVTCGCADRRWAAVSGMTYQRRTAYLYFDQMPDLCAYDGAGYLFCCRDASGGYPADTSYECGEMAVCYGCHDKHPSATARVRESSLGEDRPWPHLDAYDQGLVERDMEQKTCHHVVMTPHGPVSRAVPTPHGPITVDTASSALVAAGHNPGEADWWIWMAGWYPDCPAGIVKHI